MAVLNLEKHCLKILISQNQYQKQLKLLNSASRSEEHTSELQSRGHIVCRLLHQKKSDLTRDVNREDLRIPEPVHLREEDREEAVESGEASEEVEDAQQHRSKRSRETVCR